MIEQAWFGEGANVRCASVCVVSSERQKPCVCVCVQRERERERERENTCVCVRACMWRQGDVCVRAHVCDSAELTCCAVVATEAARALAY